MIEKIDGIIQEIADYKVIIQAHGIGFGITTPHPQEFSIGTTTSILVYMHWNQENGPSLYGFKTALDRELFALIISCNGIGPKLAITALSDLGATGFIQAITANDDRTLSKISGIGAKKAEQIIVQLKHKIHKLLSSGIDVGDTTSLAVWRDIDQALLSLNYSRSEISQTIELMKKDKEIHTLPFDQLLRRALVYITRQQ